MNYDEIVSGLILELRRGTLILLVLSQLKEPMYGYNLVKKLQDNGIPIEANTLYPLMRRLESQGLLKSEWETSEAKPRKYYKITDDGLIVLERVVNHWNNFSQNVNKLLEDNNENDLIERYIYAVTKRLPQKVQKDISDELRTLIDDMLVERCGELVPEEKDIRVVLTELGTPEELYEKYNPDNKKCLIGSPYYSTYKYVLKIVMICTIFGIILANIISGIFDFSKSNSIENVVSSTATFIASLITNLIISVGVAFGFVTALFAFFYHKDIKIDTTSNLDSLPPVPKKNEKISKVDSIISIGISVIFLVVFLTAPQIFCIVMYNEFIPIFNLETIRQTWYIIVMFSVVGIIRDVVRLIEGRYSKKVMIITIIANVSSALLAIWWLADDKIINPNISKSMTSLFDENGQFMSNIFSNFQQFFLTIIIFALMLDMLVTVFKCLKSKEK